MSQTLLVRDDVRYEMGFSIGICAADRPTGINELLSLIEHESFSPGCVLKEIVIVASGLDARTLALTRASVGPRKNIILIEEPVRRGKAEAINCIIERFTGEFLVLINSDALPLPGAISMLLDVISNDRDVGLVSASPTIHDSRGVTGAVLRLMWEVHNECLATLNEASRNNHCCDELIAIRVQALQKLPNETVNDGAFLAGTVYGAGYRVEFCRKAAVRIDVPTTFIELMRQRRRILYGHMQIFQSIGQSPTTLESMIFTDPKLGATILVRTLAKFPKLLLALPVAAVGEFVSATCAALDSTLSKNKHVPWDRVGRRG